MQFCCFSLSHMNVNWKPLDLWTNFKLRNCQGHFFHYFCTDSTVNGLRESSVHSFILKRIIRSLTVAFGCCFQSSHHPLPPTLIIYFQLKAWASDTHQTCNLVTHFSQDSKYKPVFTYLTMAKSETQRLQDYSESMKLSGGNSIKGATSLKQT